jgi:hypothetical protein
VINLAQILAVSAWFDPVVEGFDDVVIAVHGGIDLGQNHMALWSHDNFIHSRE